MKPEIPLNSFAKVVNAKGLTAYSYDGIDWQPLMGGQVLGPGARVRSQAGSSAIIFVEDQASFLKLSDSSEWVFASATDEKTALTASVVRRTPQGFRVRAVRGLAEIKESNGTWRLIRVNEVIPGGKMVRTDADSTLDLYNRNSALFLRVGPNSALHLVNQTNASGLQTGLFRLESGSVQARAQDPKTLVIRD